MEQIHLPRTTIAMSGWLATLFYLMSDLEFVRHLRQQAETTNHHGTMLLWRIIAMLKASIMSDCWSGVRVVSQFAEALLVGHWIDEDEPVTLTTALELIHRIAPGVLSFFNVEHNKWWQCSNVGCKLARVDQEIFFARIIHLDGDFEWQGNGGPKMQTEGWLKIPVPRQYGLRCPRRTGARRRGSGTRRRCNQLMRLRYLTIPCSSKQRVLILCHSPMPENMWNDIMMGRTIKFAPEKPRVPYSGMFQLEDGRLVMCLLLLETDLRYRHVRVWQEFDTKSGQLRLNRAELTRERCVSILLQPPVVSCGCGDYNDHTSSSCPVCHRAMHVRCIDEAHRTFWNEGDEWGGGAGNGCKFCSGAGNGFDLQTAAQ